MAYEKRIGDIVFKESSKDTADRRTIDILAVPGTIFAAFAAVDLAKDCVNRPNESENYLALAKENYAKAEKTTAVSNKIAYKSIAVEYEYSAKIENFVTMMDFGGAVSFGVLAVLGTVYLSNRIKQIAKFKKW
jgi:hypothetical protein